MIGEVYIDKFGVGSSEHMSPMQDAVKGEEIEFKALWVNKCYKVILKKLSLMRKVAKQNIQLILTMGIKQGLLLLEY